MNLDKEFQQIHSDLGWIRLSKAWAKGEIVLGLFGVAIAIVLLTDWRADPLGAAAGILLFVFGGYLALCGHRSHLYQSNLHLTAYLLHHIQSSSESKGSAA